MDSMATHGACSWLEYQGEDTKGAQAFYQKVLGWNVVDLPMEDGSTYPGIMVGEQPIGGFSPQPAQGGAWIAYITVDDVDARTKAAAEAGGEILTAPFSAPGVGRIAVIRDPFGATLAFITYPTKAA